MARSTPAAARPRPWRPAAPWAQRSSTAGSRGGRSSTRAGTPRSMASSARPNGPRSTPTSSKKKAVLMLNVDSAVSGHEVGFSGVPSLRDFVLEAAGVDHRHPHRQDASRHMDRGTAQGVGRPVAARPRRPRVEGEGCPRRHLGARGIASSRRRWAGWDRARITPRSSTTWGSRRSTPACGAGTACITRSTTTSTGWRSSATPSSSTMRRRLGSTRSSSCGPRRPTSCRCGSPRTAWRCGSMLTSSG